MLSINIADVVNVLNTCKPYLIGIGIVLVLALIVVIAAHKVEWIKRKLIRSEAGIAALLAIVIIVNMICFRPMNSMISLATGNGTISEKTTAKATDLVEEIAQEGIVLLKNEENELPLKNTKKLNVFGWASTNPCYGGTGSGSLSDAYEKVSLLQGLKNAGYKLNTELSDFYKEYCKERPRVGMFTQDWTLPEPPVEKYSKKMIKDAKTFSDTAVVVITRVGGEGADLPTDVSKVTYKDNSKKYKDFEEGEHYLQLSQTEKNMLDMVCENFDDVIVVYNGANAMELGFLNDYKEIKSALWCPGTGQSGFNTLGKILNGEVNPSGKTTDTFAKDLTATPTWNNFGSFFYDNTKEFNMKNVSFTGKKETLSPSFVNYVDGIYVGYRFWETAAEEGLINYDDSVMYPFGYGLSYTSFEQTMGTVTESDGEISFDVTVTNTGDTEGKDVIEAYYNPPYTNGGIEKASANLIAFEKTKMLQPGESETVNIHFNMEDMASYDYQNSKAYVLESGDYEISIREDSHHVIDTQTVYVDKTITYSGDHTRSTDQTEVTNQFDNARGEFTVLSRADGFANYEEATAAPASLSMTEEQKKLFINNGNYDPKDYNDESDQMPVTGKDNGLDLADLRGKDYDDEKWEDLLDELTVDEMEDLIALGGYQTAPISKINKVQTIDCDGPASINNNFTGTGSVGFPSTIMLASTWNKDLAKAFGESIGTMADEMGVSGWYAPAMNIHRSAFAGRNFEYYSEDGFLSGKMASYAIQGANEHGVYAYMKHFALNDQETNRNSMICTWADEQTIREIYLKPFEISVKEGKASAAMSSFNYIGGEWAGGSNALCNVVLRDEWGFRGFVLTDYFGVYGCMNSDQAIRNGTDCMLVAYDTDTNRLADSESATGVQAMRKACKNILYTVVNSRAYEAENLNTGLMTWQIAAIVIDIVFAGVIVLLEAVTIVKFQKRRKTTKAETIEE